MKMVSKSPSTNKIYPEGAENEGHYDEKSKISRTSSVKVKTLSSKQISFVTDTPVGPIDKRSCRDILFLILFMAFWAGMFYIASIAIKKGDPIRLLLPTDSQGQVCGLDNSLKNSSKANLSSRTYLYYFLPFQPATSPSVCVTECPENSAIPSMSNHICKEQVTINDASDLARYIANGTCAPFLVKSKIILNRCVPAEQLPKEIVDNATSLNVTYGNMTYSVDGIVNQGRNIAFQIFSNLSENWKYIAIGCGIATIFCFVWIVLLRFFAKPLTWLSVIFFNLAMIALTVWLYFQWGGSTNIFSDSAQRSQEVDRLQEELWQLQGSAVLFFISLVLTVIVFLITIAIRKKIKIAIEVIKEASKAIFKMPSILLLPIFQWIAFVALVIYFIWILLCLVSIDDQLTIGSEFNQNYSQENINLYLTIYHIFGFLWGSGVLVGLGQLITAGSIATYYWTMDKSRIRSFPVVRSAYRAIVFHLGSVCIGALLVSVVQLLNIILWVFRTRAKKSIEKVRFLGCLLCCVQCFLKCIEGIVKWINRNAYIYIAISGHGFCKASYKAFKLIVRNATKLVTLNMVAETLLSICKLFITVVAFLGSWAAIKYINQEQSDRSSLEKDQLVTNTSPFLILPALIISLQAYIVSCIFFGVYQMAIDTIFLCYLEDMERNDGSDEKPYYCEPSLLAITGAHSKKKVHPSKESDDDDDI